MKYSNFINKAKSSFSYRLARLQNKFALDIERLMDHQNLKQKDLAKKARVKPAYISRVLRGDTNLSMKTMLKLAIALDSDISLQVKPQRKSSTLWVKSLEQHKEQRATRIKQEAATAWTHSSKGRAYG